MWLHKVNECAVIYDWTDRQTIHFALHKLTGLAKKWYEGLPTVLYSWEQWQNKLKVAFPSHQNYGQLLTNMLAKRAKFNDCLEEYYYEKIVLINRCGAEAAQFDCPDQLLPYLKNIKNSNSFNNRKRNISSDVRPELSRGINTDRIIKCFNCQLEGHYKSQCTKPIVQCSRCSRYGHTVENCKVNNNTRNVDKTNKSVMAIDSDESSAKYYKLAFINGKPIKCFIDFGSTATMIGESMASTYLPNWNKTDCLPNLKGFGDAIVKPFGEVTAELKIDSAAAIVQILIVPDNVMRIPLLVGQNFTEQSHIFVEKDYMHLNLTSTNCDDKIKLYCCSDVLIDNITLVTVYTEPNYTGEIFIENSGRYKMGKEYYMLQGLFFINNGKGTVLPKGVR
ncbi:unnamed protein product [Euphydryas editha]|uniref:CCHC-type domain-containing protein n=2 Tax=Euphydryas editha TaxID=104508 RepID=A0AAU9UT32_EUPED|nr:unnamed protein product [Euphydryas editha]